VAVLDTGVDASVPDLAGSVTVGPNEVPGVDPPGYQPPYEHGTYIASLIAGHGSGPGRQSGIIGIAPAARILSVRVILDDSEPGFGKFANQPADDAVSNGIRYAVQHGADVINMSLGSISPTENLRAALAYAAAHGVVVAAAAGNDGAAAPGYTPFSYPAAFPGVIAVAAVSLNGDRAAFSDDNASVVLSAPGVNVFGAGPGGSYVEADGTSPASAVVAGVAALIRSRYPRLTPFQVERALTSSTSHRPRGGYNPGTGFGEVNATAALAAAGRLAAALVQPGLSASARFAHPGPSRSCTGTGLASPATRWPAMCSPSPSWLCWPCWRCGSAGYGGSGSRRPGQSSLRSRSRSRMLACTLTLPLSQARGNADTCWASSSTVSLLAVSRTSACGSPGAARCTGSAPCGPNRVTNVTSRSGTWQENERPLKKASRSLGSRSASRAVSFSKASWHSWAVAIAAPLPRSSGR
jgi:hypothetical protein